MYPWVAINDATLTICVPFAATILVVAASRALGSPPPPAATDSQEAPAPPYSAHLVLPPLGPIAQYV